MQARIVDHLLVVGVGLIGGSLALALKRVGAVGRVTGSGRNVEHLRRAVELGVIDDYSLDPGQAAASADMVFLGVPVGVTASVLQQLVGKMQKKIIITDGGSTKVGPLSDARQVLGARACRFVPGHPIAGSERSGVEAARADLYRDHKVLLTPDKETDADAVDSVERMWRATGAVVERMDAGSHDRVLGLTSHLPHILAYALVDFIASDDHADRCFDLAAGGFFDFTRIASSDPVMWRDIAISNASSLSTSLDRFIDVLEHLKFLVDEGRSTEIEQIFRNARDARERLIDKRRRQ